MQSNPVLDAVRNISHNIEISSSNKLCKIGELFNKDEAKKFIDESVLHYSSGVRINSQLKNVISSSFTGVELYRDQNFCIRLLLYKKDFISASKAVSIGAQDSLLKFLSLGTMASVNKWELFSPYSLLQINELRFNLCCSKEVTEDEVLLLDGGVHGWEFTHLDKDALVLEINTLTLKSAINISFDTATGKAKSLSPSEKNIAHIQLLSSLIAKNDKVTAKYFLPTLLKSSEYFLRWYVIRELIMIDPLAALPHLERMTESDPEQQIRQLSTSTIEYIKNKCQ